MMASSTLLIWYLFLSLQCLSVLEKMTCFASSPLITNLLLAQYFDLPKMDAIKALDVYKRSGNLVCSFAWWFSIFLQKLCFVQTCLTEYHIQSWSIQKNLDSVEQGSFNYDFCFKRFHFFLNFYSFHKSVGKDAKWGVEGLKRIFELWSFERVKSKLITKKMEYFGMESFYVY